jgi:hypothetical protein
MSEQVEYVMRVLLPSSASFHCSPSGDTDYQKAYDAAILDNLPLGFEVAWNTRDTWPKDRDGLTWVKLYCTNREDAMEKWRQEAVSAMRELSRIREVLRKF